MNPNWLGVLSALLAAFAFLVAYRGASTASLKMRLLLNAVAMVLAIPGAGFAVYYTHLLPDTAWYYQFRSISGTELLMVFVGIAGGLAATLLPRKLLSLPLSGVVAFSVAPVIKPFIGPLAEHAFRDKWQDGICLQSTPSTCGAASTATILRFLGGHASESGLAAEAHSYSGGTEAWYLARAARSRGFKVHFDFDSGFTPDGELPAVVGVRLGSIGHFIAVLGREGDRFIVGEPLSGRELLSMEELQQRYVFTGFHMRITSKDSSAGSDGQLTVRQAGFIL